MGRRSATFEAKLFLQVAAALCILIGFVVLVESSGTQTALTWLAGLVTIGGITALVWRRERRLVVIVLVSLVVLIGGYLLFYAPEAPLENVRKRLDYELGSARDARRRVDARGTPDAIERRWKALTPWPDADDDRPYLGTRVRRSRVPGADHETQRARDELWASDLRLEFWVHLQALKRAEDQRDLATERFYRTQIDRTFEELRSSMKRLGLRPSDPANARFP